MHSILKDSSMSSGGQPHRRVSSLRRSSGASLTPQLSDLGRSPSTAALERKDSTSGVSPTEVPSGIGDEDAYRAWIACRDAELGVVTTESIEHQCRHFDLALDLHGLDQDGDGTVDFEEFDALLRPGGLEQAALSGTLPPGGRAMYYPVLEKPMDILHASPQEMNEAVRKDGDGFNDTRRFMELLSRVPPLEGGHESTLLHCSDLEDLDDLDGVTAGSAGHFARLKEGAISNSSFRGASPPGGTDQSGPKRTVAIGEHHQVVEPTDHDADGQNSERHRDVTKVGQKFVQALQRDAEFRRKEERRMYGVQRGLSRAQQNDFQFPDLGGSRRKKRKDMQARLQELDRSYDTTLLLRRSNSMSSYTSSMASTSIGSKLGKDSSSQKVHGEQWGDNMSAVEVESTHSAAETFTAGGRGSANVGAGIKPAKGRHPHHGSMSVFDRLSEDHSADPSVTVLQLRKYLKQLEETPLL